MGATRNAFTYNMTVPMSDKESGDARVLAAEGYERDIISEAGQIEAEMRTASETPDQLRERIGRLKRDLRDAEGGAGGRRSRRSRPSSPTRRFGSSSRRCSMSTSRRRARPTTR